MITGHQLQTWKQFFALCQPGLVAWKSVQNFVTREEITNIRGECMEFYLFHSNLKKYFEQAKSDLYYARSALACYPLPFWLVAYADTAYYVQQYLDMA